SRTHTRTLTQLHSPENRELFAIATLIMIALTLCAISICSKVGQEQIEFSGLADEESIIYKRICRSHRRPFSAGGSNDRAFREGFIQKRTRLRHDEVGLERRVSRCVEVLEG